MSPRLAFALVAVAALAVAAPAAGDEPRRAIVLPTQLGGFIPNRQELRAALDVLVANRLRRVRVAVEAPSLSAAEKQCQDEACLGDIARRRGVDVVVATRLINDEQRADNAYHVAVRVLVRDETPALRAREQACPLCSEDQATDLLARMVAEAYANEAPPVAAAPEAAVAPVAPAAPVAAPAPVVNAAAPPARSSPWLLRGAAIGLGAGGIVALALGGWKAAQNGDVRCDPDCRRRDTSAGQAAAFTVGGVALAGAVTLAVLAWRRPGHR